MLASGQLVFVGTSVPFSLRLVFAAHSIGAAPHGKWLLRNIIYAAGVAVVARLILGGAVLKEAS